eukprot:CAMPEP_0113607510 /NCGR_PEP_ID=MMETSP0017_2-20120614/3425_1 /TAXON_ID=2856 /ORGANISM="Cylindrotheca closterium" /LENGTH=871 /DNA_ID=CAMNT_0000516123 /DNA_START=119 /DNA_END=2734 /DNA_ORIENTATION=- /assembly_acc=CAM_ASM_000147
MTTTSRIGLPNKLWFSWILLTATSAIRIAEGQNVLTQDTAKCFSSLVEADINGDSRLNQTEYVAFLKLYGVPDIGDDSYRDLPLVLQSTFFSISCICTSNGLATQPCCYGGESYIPTDGAADSQVPTQAQETYLGRLCGLTDSAVDQIIPTQPPVMTGTPSSSPSFISQSPTMNPSGSAAPTSTPSAVPTGVPTVAASQNPSTNLPLTTSPTGPPMVTKIQTQYTIAIANGKAEQINPEWFTMDLISAMDVVATEVGIIVEDNTGNRRRLTITVGLPTEIVGFEEQEWSNGRSAACPAGLANPELDSCQQVTASVDLFVDENQSEVPAKFGSVLEEEIEAGRLEEALLLIDPATPVKILAGKAQRSGPTEAPVVASDDGLSIGAMIGIGAAAAALLAVICVCMSNSKRGNESSTPRRQDDGKFVEATPSEELKMAQKEVGSGLEWQPPRAAADEEQGGLNDNPWVKKKQNDGSDVSDAGWSDAYSSSMGTNESDDERNMSPSKPDIEGTENVGDAGSANLGELEAAIQSENWAAVGASAAVLAANQYDETDSQTNSKSSSRGLDSSVQSSLNRRELDTEKTQELDNLIQSGDWEGVIQAAARYEAEIGQDQAVTVFEDSDSRSDSKSDSRSGSFTIGSHFSSIQHSSAASGGGSRATPNQAEFKREVQDLVNKVVPEEADHVDDMIEQFKGRENELLETLRTMQERNIAQKARKADQQRAKIEAKQMVTQARQEQTSADPGERVPVSGAPAGAPLPAPGAPVPAAAPMSAAGAPVPMAPTATMGGPAPMAPTPAMRGVAPMTAAPTPFPAQVAAHAPTAPDAAPDNREDPAAAAAADWAIAQALSNLERESSLEDGSYVVPDEDFDDEGSL